MMKSFQIKVPGSTANLGPGFDSIGVGLSLYLTLKVELATEWEFIHTGPNVPEATNYDTHLIYTTATAVAKRFGKVLSPCRIEMLSELPLARGLGSSAAAIVAAIELANIVADLNLTEQQKLNIASGIEGHPDNACASILGGITISSMVDHVVDTIHIPTFDPNFVVIIPNFELKTSDARAVLPNEFTRALAVTASAKANMLTASIIAKDYKRMGEYMEADLFHEPYRAKLIPDFHLIKEAAKQAGAYGTALSGAGPTMISLVPKESAKSFVEQLSNEFPSHKIILTTVDEQGITVTPNSLTSLHQ